MGLLGNHPVRVSAKSMRLRFIACGPDCIANGCTAKCCDAPTHPTGIRVYVHPSEEAGIKKHKVKVIDGFIQPRSNERLCPFKNNEHLCSLWKKPERPTGCIVSPFMLNKTDTLIVRNRYKLLPCFSHDGDFAYRVFNSSLIALFGVDKTKQLSKHLDKGGSDVTLFMQPEIYKVVSEREGALHGAK